jgi:predicted  nucleic acid-binding Zn-ribbon protein
MTCEEKRKQAELEFAQKLAALQKGFDELQTQIDAWNRRMDSLEKRLDERDRLATLPEE